MMTLRDVLLCATLATTAPILAQAQGGRLDERTEFEVIEGTRVGNAHGPLLAVVLWRGEAGWLEYDASRAKQVDSICRFARRDAEDRHLSFFGSGYAYGLVSDDRRQLTVEGRALDITRTDSALVVMVAVPALGLPRMVTTSRILADAIPDAFWPKTWQPGDTTFFVHAQYPRSAKMLRQALETSPIVRDFLR